MDAAPETPGAASATLATIAREWTRIGVTGFGGPPSHVILLRRLVVERRRWLDAREFEDANAACGLLPGPASTQLAIFCAYRVGGPLGALVGGLGFILPAVALVLALSFLFFGHAPPLWVRGAGAGAGAAVAAVALGAACALVVPSYERVRAGGAERLRWAAYIVAAAAGAAFLGPYLVLVLLACGLAELALVRGSAFAGAHVGPLAALAPAAVATGGIGALCWTALKVGALSYGGGFVIVPLMQGDAVHTYHWMTDADFVNAVALGQVTPGPVVATIAAVGYAAHGLTGGLLAAAVAFAPSFSFILLAGGRFARLRASESAQAFLAGAGPAAIGAIAGACVPLTGALSQPWQYPVLAAAAAALLVLRRSAVAVLVCAGAVGVVVALAGGPLP
ncbi:MAG TPA: chromate efflux transporter [Gaiellales bacterium]